MNEQTTRAQRLADWLTEFSGSWSFIIGFVLLLIVWVMLNGSLLLFGVFDPYPYIFLNLVLTVVSTLQGPVILMSQVRQTDRDRAAVEEINAKLDQLLTHAVSSDEKGSVA